MRHCSVFVLPSRNEALGCAYLEAMSCAKPVVACRGQGIEEIIEHEKNGWLISPDSPDDLVRGLGSLLQSPDVCSRIGGAARQTILTGLTLSHQAQHLAAIHREASAVGTRRA
jgi:glycosyltransferase involved in cell wall biosynthesis